MTLKSFLQYIQYERRFSPHTVTAYRGDLEQFSSYLEKTYQVKEIAEVNHTFIRSWMVSLMEAGVTPRSINRKITTLKTFFKFLLKNGVVVANPMLKVQSPKQSKKLPVFVEETKMEMLFEKVDFGEGYEAFRDKLLMELFYATGMRLSELVNLKEQDVNLQSCSVKILGKRNKERIVPFTNTMKRLFEQYLAEKKKAFDTKSTSLFLTAEGKNIYNKLAYRIVNKYLAQVTTLDKKSPHVLRHTFATHMLNHGADINSIKEILGHANLSATQVYTHNTIDKLKNVYKQAHPRA